MQTPNSRTAWSPLLLVATAFAATVSAVWGYDLVICRGLLAGSVSTLLRVGFLVLVSPSALITVGAIFAAFTGLGIALAALPIFRKRKELLCFLMPVAALLLGVAVATLTGIQIKCALYPWR
jgi:hypothetical protein